MFGGEGQPQRREHWPRPEALLSASYDEMQDLFSLQGMNYLSSNSVKI